MDKLVVANDVFFARVTELLALGQKVTIPVKGYSMLPFIKGEKDLVELEKADSYVPGAPEIRMIDDFAEAVKTAAALAEDGDVVLLSPACAAFDKFKNFAVRGQFFKQLVNEL